VVSIKYDYDHIIGPCASDRIGRYERPLPPTVHSRVPYVLLIVLVSLLSWAPSLWVRSRMRRHGADRADLPGTGAELVEHLARRFELEGVTVERTDALKDHYDPATRTVRLGPDNHDGRSLTAVAVAAHEVGHAIQYARGEPVTRLRQRWGPIAAASTRAGILILALLPFVGLLTRSPGAIVAIVALSIALQLFGTLAHAIVLPMEWDASFAKALPLLVEGEYLDDADLPAAREVLRAAALTYVARALSDLVNLGRWAAVVLRR